jgi:Skp family chaperone for outer membrane proteins
MQARGSALIGISIVALAAFAAGSLLPPVRAEENGKVLVAFVDKKEVAAKLRLTADLEVGIEKMRAAGNAELDRLRKKVAELRDQLDVLHQDNPLYKKILRDFRRSDLLLKHEEKALNERVNEALLDATRKTLEAIGAHCRALREKRGYTAVFAADGRVVLAFAPSVDITREVIEGMNAK